MPTIGVELAIGRMYDLELRHQAGNYRWVTRSLQRARYLGKSVMASDDLVFSGRPAYGTTSIPREWIIQATECLDPVV